MAIPVTPPTTAPAITPPDTDADSDPSLGDRVGVFSGAVVVDAVSEGENDEEAEGFASALRESELKSNVRAVAEGSAE